MKNPIPNPPSKAAGCALSFIHLPILCLITLSAGSVASVGAATVSWDGGGGNSSWHTAANWSGNAVADGPGNVVDLPGVKGRFANPKAGNADLEAMNGGPDDRWSCVHIEQEPILDAILASTGNLRLVLYGLPGHTYRLQSATSMGPGADWQDEGVFELVGTYATVERPVAFRPVQSLNFEVGATSAVDVFT